LRPISHEIEHLHAKLDAHQELHAAHAESLAALHRKLDALLKEKP
jgi:hypothetical protein